jgi:hypothetical protein
MLATTTLLLIGSSLCFWQGEAFTQSTLQKGPLHISATVPSLTRMQDVQRGFPSRHTVNHAKNTRQGEEVREPYLSWASMDVALTMFSDFVFLSLFIVESGCQCWELDAV